MTGATRHEVRTALADVLRRQLFGPSKDAPLDQQTERLRRHPLGHYVTGVLMPEASMEDLWGKADTERAQDQVAEPEDLEEPGTAGATSQRRPTEDDDEDGRLPEPSSHFFVPRTVGLTCLVPDGTVLVAQVTGGRYQPEQAADNEPAENDHECLPSNSEVEGAQSASPERVASRPVRGSENAPITRPTRCYRRVPYREHHEMVVTRGSSEFALPGALSLVLDARDSGSGQLLATISLVNRAKAGSLRDILFQSELSLRAASGRAVFEALDGQQQVRDRDEESLDLLYRNRQNFAKGRNSAAEWEPGGSGGAHEIRTAAIPRAELSPVVPRTEDSAGRPLELSFQALHGETNGRPSADGLLEKAENLCDDYELWIERQEDRRKECASHIAAADRHLRVARECLERLRAGVELLRSDQQVLAAFMVANRALLMQRVHTGLPHPQENDSAGSPVYEDQSQHAWYPFQLAFVLMNLRAIAAEAHVDRDLVDLIWFPTGGGKTEAYLGLTAVTIALRRLRDPSDNGTVALMRYTLRLLTAQQFQRAAALILALDRLREENFLGVNLGSKPISIGLWVGASLTPNRRSEAVRELNELGGRDANRKGNVFQLLRCPWCKADFSNPRELGYETERIAGQKSVVFSCPNRVCDFHRKAMPICVIDDDLYDRPPTLLIGTVDKFAQLAWSDRPGRFFGSNESKPPDLIIQDELHLIGGPLGTVVAAYEGVVDLLCSKRARRPKIIGSSATVRRAEEQCQRLYSRETRVFPPQGLDAGDSYFAVEETDAEAPGRLYLGVFPSAMRTQASAQVRVVAVLQQAVQTLALQSEEATSPFGTLVWYFSSLRKLGHALTLCHANIPEEIVGIARDRELSRHERRGPATVRELTSRRSAAEIPDILEQLEKPWTPRRPEQHGQGVDVLLASSMISVGVDVPRLALMCVNDQPKLTSEYIQASSRVGRKTPGLVIVLYNQYRSRDRSIYEDFQGFHQSLYRHVEPSSLTPLAAAARLRTAPGVLSALARQIASARSPADLRQHRTQVEEAVDRYVDRFRSTSDSAASEMREELLALLGRWIARDADEWGNMAKCSEGATTLLEPFGSLDSEGPGSLTLTSMRSVDASCRAEVVDSYPTPGETK